MSTLDDHMSVSNPSVRRGLLEPWRSTSRYSRGQFTLSHERMLIEASKPAIGSSLGISGWHTVAISLDRGSSSYVLRHLALNIRTRLKISTAKYCCLAIIASLRIHTWIHMWERLARCRMNPQLNACFADEDFIRQMCSIALCLQSEDTSYAFHILLIPLKPCICLASG